MKYDINQPVYYIPYVRVLKHIEGIERKEYPIYQDNILCLIDPEKEVSIMIPSGSYGINIVKLFLNSVELFVQVIVPKFKLGQILKRPGISGSFRVWEYTIINGKVWYRNGWGVATDCESGFTEEELRLATKEEAAGWEVKYNDDLIKEKKPVLYNCLYNKF